MTGSHRFAIQRDGKGRFAGVTLHAEAGAFDEIHWAAEVSSWLRAEYAGEVAAGVADARRWHIARGGADALIKVIHIEQVLSDTTPDAVRLAATAAAWKALGNTEETLQFDKESDCWVPVEA